MVNLEILSPTCVRSIYSPQHIPQYVGNRLIEALPPAMNEEELYGVFSAPPPFAPEQRQWTIPDRIKMLKTLKKFMVPFAKHIELAHTLDAMLRNGYVGRAPRTPEHTGRFQAAYEKVKCGTTLLSAFNENTAQSSQLMMGWPGMGKTSAVNRWFQTLPQVIYHEELNLYQVTYIRIELPNDGASVKGLATGILKELDRLIPAGNYFERYAARGNPSEVTLMHRVGKLMNDHCVGFVIADEVQNLARAKKGQEVVMAELVSACNELGAPLLFIGTNKAAKVFSEDFHLSRRGCGEGIGMWLPLAEHAADGQESEWLGFLKVLWKYQWVQRASELDGHLAHLMYYFSQGIIDVAIKLFACAQARAMLDGSERLSAELLEDVYKTELQLLHPMLNAIRSADVRDLQKFQDIAPVQLDELLSTFERKARARSAAAYSVKSTDADFPAQLAASLVMAGFDGADALDAAQLQAQSPSVKTLHEGALGAIRDLTHVRRTAKKRPGNGASVVDGDTFTGRPDDYRRAVFEARNEGISVIDKLKTLGMTKPVDDLLNIR